MSAQNKINLLFVLFITMVLVLACRGGNEMRQASDMVVEANKANADAAKNIGDVDKRFAQLFGGDVDLDDRKKFEPTAKDALDSLEKAHAKLAEGIQKLDAASKLNIEDWYKEYVSTIAQSFRNADKRIDVMKDTANLYMDYSLDAQTLMARYKELLDKDDKIQKEAAEIDAKIKKIEEANKDKLKG